MRTEREHHTEHRLVVAAPPRVLYGLVADVTAWPAVFGPSVHVRHLDRSEREERFELWATVNGAVSTWTSRRTLDPGGLRVTFDREVSAPPIASMGGEWRFRALPGNRCEVVLLHRFTTTDDDPGTVGWVTAALDRNSPEELAALARVAQSGHPVEDVVFSFTDARALSGSAAGAYEFVARADLWAERLPHVSRAVLSEPAPGVQDLELDTVTADGSRHTTRSVRMCGEGEWIAYKQVVTPELLHGHSGLWTFTEGPEGALVTSRHTVVINPGAVGTVLGAGKTVADAKVFVRNALGRNSATTMSSAAAFAAEHSARSGF
ncbi:aromatase/cyclase [Actinokineospora spheciospongiae]|uniref:aromatase/cyclase n=1 Tax=Actinokineospora spheciospongiae TaxID=909613 RepID=UPI000D714411|nr:aromatase/cyclase [Actinokineospora spheciospongiae]PWW63180.1 aromatase [Actinokineospora spheciospongiae]